jgi:hypothetical protein
MLKISLYLIFLLFLWLYVSLCSFSVCFFIYFSTSLYLNLSLCLFCFFPLSLLLYLCVSLFSFSLFLCPSISVFLCLSLSLLVALSLLCFTVSFFLSNSFSSLFLYFPSPSPPPSLPFSSVSFHILLIHIRRNFHFLINFLIIRDSFK